MRKVKKFTYIATYWEEFKEKCMKILQYKKKDIGILFLVLALSNICNIFFTVVMQNSYSLAFEYYIVVFITFQLFSTVLNNIVYFYFLKKVRREGMSMKEISYYFHHFLPQICCMWLISLIQTVLSTFIVLFLPHAIIIQQSLLLIISAICMLLVIHIAFQLGDNQIKTIALLQNGLHFLKKEQINFIIPCLFMAGTSLLYDIVGKSHILWLELLMFGFLIFVKLYFILFTGLTYENTK